MSGGWPAEGHAYRDGTNELRQQTDKIRFEVTLSAVHDRRRRDTTAVERSADPCVTGRPTERHVVPAQCLESVKLTARTPRRRRRPPTPTKRSPCGTYSSSPTNPLTATSITRSRLSTLVGSRVNLFCAGRGRHHAVKLITDSRRAIRAVGWRRFDAYAESQDGRCSL